VVVLFVVPLAAGADGKWEISGHEEEDGLPQIGAWTKKVLAFSSNVWQRENLNINLLP